MWNPGFTKSPSTDYSDGGHNISYNIDYDFGTKIYFTITLDTKSPYEKNGEYYYKQIVYLNGQKLYEGGLNKKQWDGFISTELNDLNYFCIGRCSQHDDGWWHYSKMNAYTLRLYNHALSEEDIINNYEKSVAYHENLQ